MNVAFLIGTVHGGGAERVIANLSNQFAVKGHKSVLITFYRNENEYEINGNVIRYNLRDAEYKKGKITGFVYTQKKLRKICKREKIDVLVSFMRGANYYNIFAGIGNSMKSVLSVRNDPKKEYEGGAGLVTAKLLFNLADGCVFQTEDAKNCFSKFLQKKSRIILNPIHSIFYERKYEPKKYRVIASGRLEKQKNHKLLIDAFKDVIKQCPDAQLYIYGEGACETELRSTISDLNMQEQVFLKGRTNDMAEALSKADIYVMSSDYEGLPNALMEAMAIGIPSVATDCPCGGPKLLFEDEKNGCLISVGNKKELTEKIVQLLQDDELKKNYSSNAKIKAEQFKNEKIYDEWEKFLSSII